MVGRCAAARGSAASSYSRPTVPRGASLYVSRVGPCVWVGAPPPCGSPSRTRLYNRGKGLNTRGRKPARPRRAARRCEVTDSSGDDGSRCEENMLEGRGE